MDQDFPALLSFPPAHQNQFPFLLAFHHHPSPHTLWSLLHSSYGTTFSVLRYVLFLLYTIVFLSAYRAFQLYYFSCKQAAAWQKHSKDVPTSQLPAQYFSPNSFLGEFTGGRVSKETARKMNFSHCHGSIHPVEDAPAPSLSVTPLKQKKRHLAIREVDQQQWPHRSWIQVF